MSHILVIGGSGFIGREVCRFGVANGHTVRSVSRSGRPSPDETRANTQPATNTQQKRSSNNGRSWADHVQWVAADVFDPTDWRHQLLGCDAVIHTVGITREAPSEGVTFERTNGDSAIIAGLETERAGVDSFVFISVSLKPPFLSERYLIAKRRAERALTDLDFRNIILRPGPLYGEGNPHYPQAVSRMYEFIDNYDWFAHRLGAGQPLSVETVAATALRAAIDPALTGVLEIPAIRNEQPAVGSAIPSDQ